VFAHSLGLTQSTENPMPKADQPNITVADAPLAPHAKPSAEYANYATKLADANASAADLMRDIRAAATYLNKLHGYSLMVFAHMTGLHKNSVMRLSDPTWMPKPETLQQLDKLIVRAEAKRRGRSSRARRSNAAGRQGDERKRWGR
jgi:hypothetical protein